jgi:uncharacterized protein (TIGR02246 family)
MKTGAGTGLSEDDVRAIEALHDRWIADERAGNARAVLDLCDDDVLWLPPGGRPMRGRQTILHWLSGPAVSLHDVTLSNLEIAGEGRVAWKTCEFVTTYYPEGANRPVIERGSHLWVLHKTDAGEWRVVVATWTLG